MPHTLEYNYSLPSPTPVDLTLVAAGSGVPGGTLDPWFLNIIAASMLQQVKTKDKDEDMVAAPSDRQPLQSWWHARSPVRCLAVLLPGRGRPLSSSGGDPGTGFFARGTHGSRCTHEGEGPLGSSSGRDVADPDALMPPRP